MQKTLGGDRLGSGKKMKVQLQNYGRSTHNQNTIWRSTMSAGTLVPCYLNIGLPGTTFDLYIDADVKTHPTLGPLFGSMKFQTDFFIIPMRLYQGKLHNNKLGIGLEMATVLLPIIELTAQPFEFSSPGVWNVPDIDNAQINPSAILAYLGIRGIGNLGEVQDPQPREFNAIPWLGYWDTVKNYYANKQEGIGAVIHTPRKAVAGTITDVYVQRTDGTQQPIVLSPAIGDVNVLLTGGMRLVIEYSGTLPDPNTIMFNTTFAGRRSLASLGTVVSASAGIMTVDISTGFYTIANYDRIGVTEPQQARPEIVTFPLTTIDDAREAILANTTDNAAFNVASINQMPYNLILGANQTALLSSQEGLALKTYQSDMFNNWLDTEWIDGAGGIAEVTRIDTTTGGFNIDTFILNKKVYNMLNQIGVSGGTYDDYLDAVYTEKRSWQAETPVYVGGLIKEVVFQEVISNAEVNAEQPLGALAGRGMLGKKHKGGKITIHCDEPCYIMGITSITPRTDYSQGNAWHVHLKSIDDLHKPAMDGIGFQEDIIEERAWWNTTFDQVGAEWVQHSAGKHTAWLKYQTEVNRTYGNFAIQDNEMFMTLNRRYEAEEVTGQIQDLTTYIDPSKYNNIFAQTSLDAQNYWVQIAIDCESRRKMSGRVMPNI